MRKKPLPAFAARLVGHLIHAASGPKLQTIPNAQGAFGYSSTNPIPVNSTSGEIAYIRTLQCACDTAFLFHRIGNAGPGPDGHMVDTFELLCRHRLHHVTLYFDMYHRGASPLLPEGLRRGTKVGTGVIAKVTPFPDGLPAALARDPVPPKLPSFAIPSHEMQEGMLSPRLPLNLDALDSAVSERARTTFQRIVDALGEQPSIDELLAYVVRYRGMYLRIKEENKLPDGCYGYVVWLADCDLIVIRPGDTPADRVRAVLHLVMHLLLDEVEPYQQGIPIRVCGPTHC